MKNNNNNYNDLFGDYELLIDECLGGDPEVKLSVAQADRYGRRGLKVLMNALKNKKASMSPFHIKVLAQCKEDQAHYEALQKDLRSIEERDLKYRARVTVGHNRFRRTFDDLRDVQVWRDKMQCLAAELEFN